MTIVLTSPRGVLKCVESMTLLSVDAVAMHKDKFIKSYSVNNSAVCEIRSLVVK